MSDTVSIKDFGQLASVIEETHRFFSRQVQKQVNIALTLRNWLIGRYIVEYEQNGADRAKYGKALIAKLSANLRQRKLKGFSEIALRLNRSFYLTYPRIQQTVSVIFHDADNHTNRIQQTVSVKFETTSSVELETGVDIHILLNNLSFSHFIELIKANSEVSRAFYETAAIKNNWTVRELKRAMNSLLYERTGLSKRTYAPEELSLQKENTPDATEMFRNPLILEFLGLEEKTEYSENELEQAIIDHLQSFLLEIGRGFCFEARQKRITFDNTHYRIDLVFYHRILKCHVLIDLKIGEFTHADSGQMNVYLNYYKEHEMEQGDQPPVGIILCAYNNESLVKYATAGLSHKLFVSKYMINLPNEDELKTIIQAEQNKIKR